MEALSSTMYEFPPGTVEDIRKIYNLDQPGRMEESINILDGWIQKQTYFVKKDFSREYLERTIINCKGSVERAKTSVKQFCTLRSQLPKAFLEVDDEAFQCTLNNAPSVPLPKFAPNYHRVCLVKCLLKESDPSFMLSFYKYSLAYLDYQINYDYFNGFILVLDYTELDIPVLMSTINPIELRLMIKMYIEGYSVRMQAIHIVTQSKLVDIFVRLLKQVVSLKIRDRIHVHKSIEDLYDVVPREILPAEYGGQEKTLRELQEDWCAVLRTEEHKELMRAMNHSVTEEFSQENTSCNEYTGLPGTFRTLAVD